MLKNNESVVATQRAFRQHFNIHRNDSVSARNAIKLWIKNFRQTACATKKKPEGRPRSVRTPENVEQVRRAVVNSPQRSTRKLASALGITEIFGNDCRNVLTTMGNTSRTRYSKSDHVISNAFRLIVFS
ncbi:hypothetical protein C0J52_23663 [Blattella germanica]|nr:hypothetical protein C0J52_23663 [Blattella germanica]